MDFTNIPNLVQKYLFYIKVIKNRSPKTVDAYATDLRDFFRFLKIYKFKTNNINPKDINHKDINHKSSVNINLRDIDDNKIESISLNDVYEYLNFTIERKNNSDKARARKISSIKGFFKYLTLNLKLLTSNPVEHLDSPSLKKTLPKYLTLNESRQLLRTKQKSKKHNKLRDYCILTLFLNCGMRISEMVKINLNDINLEEGTLKLLGKGNKERIIFLNQACKSAIKNYIINERNITKNTHYVQNTQAFITSSTTGKRLSIRRIQKIVKTSMQEAGLYERGFSPHKLRHTAATLLYQHGNVDILTLKELLGHSNVGTTQIYTHISNNKLKQAVSKNPLADELINSDD